MYVLKHGGVLTLLLMALLLPIQARSHASLLETRPASGMVLDEPPPMVSLRFSEPVSPVRVQLLDGNGNPITLTQADSENNTLNYTAEFMPGDGQYLLSYRVLSMDAHPISGSVGFVVGDMPAPVVNALTNADSTTLMLVRAVRSLYLISLLASIGLTLFPLLFLQPAALEALRRKWLWITCSIGIGAAIIGLGLWGVLLAELSPVDIFQSGVWTLANSTTLAKSTLLVVLGLTMILLSTGYTAGLLTRLLSGGGALIAIVGLASSGHAATANILLSPVFMLHTLMAGLWFGALWVLLPLTSRGPDETTVQVLKQFSRRASIIVIVLLGCAAILGWYQLGSVSALFESDYGNWLLLKTGLVSLVLILAALNRWRFTPALEHGVPHARSRLFGAIRIEVAVMAIVIAVTTLLASTPPPDKIVYQKTYFANSTSDSALSVKVSITPAGTGPNTVELTFSEATASVAPKEITLRWLNTASGIEPLAQTVTASDTGIYRMNNVDLLVRGEWQFRIEALIDDFTIRRFELTVPIEK